MENAPRRLYYLVAAIGLVLYLWGFFTLTRLATLDTEALPTALSYPALIEGMPAGSSDEVRRLAEGFPPGTLILLESSDGTQTEVVLPNQHTSGGLVLILISGLLFWSVSAFVIAPRVGHPAARRFFWATFLYGLAVMIGGVYFPKEPVWFGIGFNLIQIASLAVLPPLFVYLSLSFPRRAATLDRFRWFMPVLWLLAVLLAAWQGWAFHRYYWEPGTETIRMLWLSHSAGQGLLVVQVAAVCVILFLRERRFELTREKDQVKWLLWGFFAGVTPYVFLRQLPDLLGMTPPLGAEFDRVIELAIPLIILFAVVRYQFLDIDIIIRRSLIYGILAGIVVGLYLVAGLLIGKRFEEHPSAWALVLLVIGLGAGVMFSPFRNWIGRWVDRTFFKMRHDYDLALAAVRRELETASSQTEAARILVGFFEKTLQPVPRGVVLGEDPVVGAGTLSSSQASVLVDQLGKNLRGTVAAPNTTSLPEIESLDFPEEIREAGVVLIQPIHPERVLEGFILLGTKASGWRYIDTDIHLIQNVAEAAGTTLERIRLVQTVSEETLARQRLAELNRLKNEFLLRVAHDLRTPLASITWSTENLLDGVTGELTPAQAEYLISIKTSAIHLNRLVSNLLEISRLEQETSDLELESMDLAPVIEQAATTLKPTARERDVEIRVHVDEEATMVLANPGKVFEVAMNLLDNAVKYSPPGTAVDIFVGRLEDGQPGFSVRDRGPGFDPEDAQKLFEQFQQGDPSPHSQQHGFGLGLYIVKSYLSLMNGDVEAGVHREGGAVFTCILPETTQAMRNEE